MTALETRKQLLIAESELNRAMLAHEAGIVAVEMRVLTHRVKRWVFLGSILLAVAKGFSRAAAPPAPKVKRTLGQKVIAGLKGTATFLFTIWARRLEKSR